MLSDISDQAVLTGKEAEFQCEITINYPEIALSWYKGTQKLDSSDKYDISVSGDRHLLRIRRCQPSDQGNYRVVCGPHISSAKLTVMGPYGSWGRAVKREPGFLTDDACSSSCLV